MKIYRIASFNYEQKEFGDIRRKNRAMKKAWQRKQAGINREIPKNVGIVNNPDYGGFDEFVFDSFSPDEFNNSSTRRTAELNDLDKRIRSNSGNKYTLDPEWRDDVEKLTDYRDKNKNTGDTINKKFQDKKEKILRDRNQKSKFHKRTDNLPKKIDRNLNIKKLGKIALGTAAAAGLAYGAKKLYDKKKDKE